MPDPAHSSPAYGRPDAERPIPRALLVALEANDGSPAAHSARPKLSIDRALEFIAAEDIFWTHR